MTQSLFICWTYLQHRALLEAKAIFEQTSDVGHVHAQKRKGRRLLGHLAAHYSRTKSLLSVRSDNRAPVNAGGTGIAISGDARMHVSPALAFFLKSLTWSDPPWMLPANQTWDHPFITHYRCMLILSSPQSSSTTSTETGAPAGGMCNSPQLGL